MIRHTALAAALALAACGGTAPAPAPDGAPDGAPDACWHSEQTPAVIETVTEQRLVAPAELDAEGRVTRPAVYRTDTAQRIVRERAEIRFETPCPDVLTADFVASLQRALAARGLYRGPVTGRLDAATRAAVRAFQTGREAPSGVLSLAAARRLGLVAVDAPEG